LTRPAQGRPPILPRVQEGSAIFRFNYIGHWSTNVR
jgi:hypothetical protein